MVVRKRKLCTVVCACGTLGVESPKLFRMLNDFVEWFVQEGNAQDISNCALALSLLGIQSPTFFSALAEARLDKYLADSITYGVCSVCYAIVVLDDSVSECSACQSAERPFRTDDW